MQTDGGSSEANAIITFLDLPHASTFHTNTFPRVQNAMRPAIKRISQQCMEKARAEEVLQTIGLERCNDWKEKKIDAKEVKLTISYDMGWNKRSSGHKYDSMSGHGFVLGGQSKKVLQFRCMSKQCSKCALAAKNKVAPKTHECPKNHEGSSKSMETEAIFRMTKEAFRDLGYTLSNIIIDDDSTTKSNLKHSWKDMIEAGLLDKSDWPRTKAGAKK